MKKIPPILIPPTVPTSPARKPGSLGRGLSSLLGQEAEEDGARVRLVPLDALGPNPFQPRRRFGEESLAELAESIRNQGVLQPILVRKAPPNERGEKFEIIAGERRWRAARDAGLSEVPVLQKEVSDREALEAAILENVQRQDLTAMEEAEGYSRLLAEFGYTHEQVAGRLGKSRVTVTNTLRLLQLPETVREMVENGELTAGHGRALLALGERPEQLLMLARETADKGWSVRELERRVQGSLRGEKGGEEKSLRKDPGLMELEEKLGAHLETGVTITQQRGRGKVILEYQDLAGLERLALKLLET